MKPDKDGSLYNNSIISIQLRENLYELSSVTEGYVVKYLTET